MTPAHPFDKAVRLDTVDGNTRRGRTQPEWANMVGPYGGITAAILVGIAAAMISGIEDALSSYGVRIDEAPISPAKLFQLIRAANAKGIDAPDMPRKERAVG